MTRWLGAFLMTQAIEVPIYLALLREGTLGQRLGAAFGASLLTHPLVWFVLPLVFTGDPTARIAASEAFAVAAEALYLRACGQRGTVVPALVANAASASLGLACRHWFGWP